MKLYISVNVKSNFSMKLTWTYRVIVFILQFELYYQISKQETPLKTYPYLGNCMTNAKDAKGQSFVARTGFILPRLWMEESPGDADRFRQSHHVIYKLYRWLVNEDPEKVQPRSYSLANFKIESEKIRVPPFAVEPGLYKIITTAPGLSPSIPDRVCYFSIEPIPPVIVLHGGSYRIVPSNHDLELSAEESVDPNRRFDAKNLNSLHFYWRCTQKILDYCKIDLGAATPSFTIPAKKVVNNDRIHIMLTVVPSYQTKEFTVVEQTIDVVAHAAWLRISCLRNCPPVSDVSNYQQKTSFRVICEVNCGGFNADDYKWEVKKKGDEKFKFNYERDTHGNGTGIVFDIKANVLEPAVYEVSVALAASVSRKGKARIDVSFVPVPKITSCIINPATGVSLKTRFTLSCEEGSSRDRNNFYELFADDKMEVQITSGFYPDVFKTTFFLPTSKGRRFNVRIRKGGGPAITIRVNPQVISAHQGKTEKEINELYKGFATATSKMESDDPKAREQAIKLFQTFVNEIIAGEISFNQTYNIAKTMTYAAAESLLRHPTETSEQLVLMSDALTKLIEHAGLATSDPKLGNIVTEVCKLMITRNVEDLKHNPFPMNSETQFNQVGSVLRRCLDKHTEANFDLLKSITHNISVFDIPTVKLEGGIIEDYPDYADYTDKYQQHMSNLKKITGNVINATAIAAKGLAMLMPVGDHVVRRSYNHSATLVVKGEGSELSRTKFQLLDATVVPSHDFDNNSHSFDILISTWSRDLMWWNHHKTRVVTKIVSVQFWHSKCKKLIRHFKSPATIMMHINSLRNFTYRTISGNISVPRGYKFMITDDLNKHIKVHKVFLPRHAVLHVNFTSVYEMYKFDVVLTKYYFPTIEDFVFSTTFSGSNNEIRIVNYDYYNIWVYFAILPSKESPNIRLSQLFYDVSFTWTLCVRWNNTEAAWKPECKPGIQNNLQIITCDCRHFSVYAGYIQNAHSREQEVWSIDVYLELQTSYVIFVTVSITLGIYCLLIIIKAYALRSQLYFLADNQREHLYAYLLIVRTNLGTTSRVVIQLTGSKDTSEPHCLNYPDPKMYLLQNEDRFVLTTERHLGDIKKIELWFDSSGPSPSWHCRDIIIYDMQKLNQWYFKTGAFFSVSKPGCTYLEVKPTKTESSESGIKEFRICNHFHTWQLWCKEGNFSYVERVTVVFSNVLMIYVFVLIMQGTPSLELKDCLDPHKKYKFHSNMITCAALASLGSFSIHVLIAWIFRFSNVRFSAFQTEFKRHIRLSRLCWPVLIILITTTLSILIILGFWLPETSSFIWLVCCLMGILIDIIIWENIFIIFQLIICEFKLILDLDKKREAYLKMIEAQRLALYKKFDASMLRPYMSHLYTPLEKMQTVRRRIVVELRRNIYEDLVDLVMYGIYNIILYMTILMTRGNLNITSKTMMESIVEGKHTRTMAFSEISELKHLYEYLNETLIPAMHPSIWYENLEIKSSGMMIDVANKYIGVARLRQHRLTAGTCHVPQVMKFVNMTCWPEFTIHNAEMGEFGPKWTKKSSDSNEFDRLSTIWTYLTESEAESEAIWGRIGSYSGGGYIAYLGRTLVNSCLTLKYLMNNFWVERQIRSLFIEFLAYNANYNVFVAVTLLFEQSATGYTSSFTEVNVIRMLFVENEQDRTTKIIFALFFIWLMLLTLKLSVGIIKHLETFYKRVWLMIDFVINVMSMACISMFILRMSLVEDYLNNLETTAHKNFVSYSSLLNIEWYLTVIAGFLVCIATARLWRFLRFGLFFRILERTLSTAAFPLIAVTLAFAVILTAFGLTGILFYGDEIPELSSYVKIVGTLIQLSLKPDQFDLSQYLYISISYSYFTCYLVLMQVVLFVYIIVIIMSYVKARMEFSVEPNSYTVTVYMQERMSYLPILIRSRIDRMRGGVKDKNPVTPKADEFLYANALRVAKSRLEAMKFIVCCVIRNMTQSTDEQGELTENEHQLMLGICRQLVLRSYGDDQYEDFFKGHFEGQKLQLIDGKKIYKIAVFTSLMFSGVKRRGSEKKSDMNLVNCYRMIKEKNESLKISMLTLQLMLHRMNTVESMCNDLYVYSNINILS